MGDETDKAYDELEKFLRNLHNKIEDFIVNQDDDFYETQEYERRIYDQGIIGGFLHILPHIIGNPLLEKQIRDKAEHINNVIMEK